jgi:L-fucose mutarotase
VLKLPVIHPVLLGALARAGHGSTILIADGNYPHSTGAASTAERVFLNFSPGVLTVEQVLRGVAEITPIERATVMQPADHDDLPLFAAYRTILGMTLERLDRFDFYAAARTQDLTLLIATADEQHYANILLTVGVRDDPRGQ